MNIIQSFFVRVVEKVFMACNLIVFFKNKAGLKNIGANRLLQKMDYKVEDTKEIRPELLYLGPDFLKDKYTLLDCPVSTSPHFGLMKALNEKAVLRTTDYFRRFNKGTLDWRRSQVMPRSYNKFHNKYVKSQKEINDNKYNPVLVYYQNGRYYIYDGKHRAALCALMNKPVLCAVVSNSFVNTGLWHYMFSIIEKRSDYSRHNQFHYIYLKGEESR